MERVTNLSSEEILSILKDYFYKFAIIKRQKRNMRCSFYIGKAKLNVYDTGNYTIKCNDSMLNEELLDKCLTTKLDGNYEKCLEYLKLSYDCAPVHLKQHIIQFINLIKEDKDKK